LSDGENRGMEYIALAIAVIVYIPYTVWALGIFEKEIQDDDK